MYTESNVKLSCNALWQKCVLATLYRAAATHPEIKLLQFKLILGQGINKAIPSLMADFTGELHRLISEYLQCKRRKDKSVEPRYFIRTPYNGVLASQTRHDYCPQSSMIRGVMSPGLVGRW